MSLFQNCNDFSKILRSLGKEGQTLEDNTVTVRNRDTAVQKRVNIDALHSEILCGFETK